MRARLTAIEIGERRVGRVLIAFMALGFAALLATAIAIGWITTRNQAYTSKVIHTQDVRQEIAALQVTLEQSETARRGYILSGARLFHDAYVRTSATIPGQIDALRVLTIDNPHQTVRLDRIARQFARLLVFRRQSIALVDAGKRTEAQRHFSEDAGVTVMRGIRYRLQAMAGEEAMLLARRAQTQQAATALFFATAGVAAVLLVIVAILSWIVVRRYTGDLAASRDSLRRLNDDLEHQVATRTADLTRANAEIQRFAYIVSHDLRSPLVNVMGFTAELEAATVPLATLVERAEAEAPAILTEDARLAAREDLPEAIRFIRTSTQKMDRLINAILKLSREGRRTLAPEPLDIAGLVETIAASMQHRIDERRVAIAVERPMPVLVSDRFAVEQILSNLIENAIKYLKPGPGGRIAVSAQADGAHVTIAVADNGRGIAAGDHERVFDLFRRSGVQDQPGEGIGLAHVRALAYRLGGRIELTSVLGEGATFRLILPASEGETP